MSTAPRVPDHLAPIRQQRPGNPDHLPRRQHHLARLRRRRQRGPEKPISSPEPPAPRSTTSGDCPARLRRRHLREPSPTTPKAASSPAGTAMAGPRPSLTTRRGARPAPPTRTTASTPVPTTVPASTRLARTDERWLCARGTERSPVTGRWDRRRYPQRHPLTTQNGPARPWDPPQRPPWFYLRGVGFARPRARLVAGGNMSAGACFARLNTPRETSRRAHAGRWLRHVAALAAVVSASTLVGCGHGQSSAAVPTNRTPGSARASRRIRSRTRPSAAPRTSFWPSASRRPGAARSRPCAST